MELFGEMPLSSSGRPVLLSGEVEVQRAPPSAALACWLCGEKICKMRCFARMHAHMLTRPSAHSSYAWSGTRISTTATKRCASVFQSTVLDG